MGDVQIAVPTPDFHADLTVIQGLLDDLARELAENPTAPVTVAVVDGTAVHDVSASLRGAGSVVSSQAVDGRNGPAVNRNRAAKLTSSDWLVFLDNDVRLPNGWLRAALDIMSEPDAADLIGGRIGSQRPHNWFSQAAEDFVVRHREYPEGWYLAAACLLVRRPAFDDLSGFDDTFDYGAEDWDFCARAHTKGLKVGVSNRISVAHANATTWRALKVKATQYGRANAMFDARNRSASSVPHESAITELSEGDVEHQGQSPPRSPGRIWRWLLAEYKLFLSQSGSRTRAARSALLQGLWMREYFRSYNATSANL